MRQKLNALLNDNARYGHFSVAIILISLVPLMFKDEDSTLLIVDYATTAVFIFDYVARWAVADLNLGRGRISFLIYPFTPMAIIDLLTILPTFFALNQGFKALRMIRMVRILKFARFIRRSRSWHILTRVFQREKSTLGVVCVAALAYVYLTALITFNIEPDTFSSFAEAVYWACATLTTVGYGDVYPVTQFGRAVAMFSALVGIAVVALPAGIITGGYIDVMHEMRDEEAEAEHLAQMDAADTAAYRDSLGDQGRERTDGNVDAGHPAS
jgi:voltage-gated potassium channel